MKRPADAQQFSGPAPKKRFKKSSISSGLSSSSLSGKRENLTKTQRTSGMHDTTTNKQRQSISDASASDNEDGEATEELLDLDNPKPPAWYKDPKLVKIRDVSLDSTMGQIKAAVQKVHNGQLSGTEQDHEFAKLSSSLHRLMVAKVKAGNIRNNFMLHQGGLPGIFSAANSKKFPYYIVADAKELYNNWYRKVFDADIFRGIIVGSKKDVKLNRSSNSDKLDPKYPYRLSAKYHGNSNLSNGQWWPRQIATLRDGAHGKTQAGISGKPGQGAWSVIVAGKYKEDIDRGDEILYCGTEDDEGNGTSGTTLIMENIQSKQPVRVIRSFKGHNKIYSPVEGLRFDGLYDVVDSEVLDIAKKRYRFRLVRQAGQDPIRYEGAAARPTTQELAALDNKMKERGFLVGKAAEVAGRSCAWDDTIAKVGGKRSIIGDHDDDD